MRPDNSDDHWHLHCVWIVFAKSGKCCTRTRTRTRARARFEATMTEYLFDLDQLDVSRLLKPRGQRRDVIAMLAINGCVLHNPFR
jgi:hypothetical protein